MVKTDEHGYATEGITAQVIIPGNLPTYGTPALNNYPITIKVSENCTKHVPTFAMIVAHELTHVLFYSLNHPQKDNEIYTDLNAMMQGFLNIYSKGRKITHEDRTTNSEFVTTTTTTYGYLSDKQFQFASNRINKLLEKAREKKRILAEEINKTSKLIMEYNVILDSFNKNLEYLTKNTKIRISGDDGKKMVMFFQPDYMENICSPINGYSQKQKRVKKYIENLTHYTTITLKDIANFMDISKIDNEKLRQNICSLSKDNKVMEKYTGHFSKIKNWFLKKVFG